MILMPASVLLEQVISFIVNLETHKINAWFMSIILTTRPFPFYKGQYAVTPGRNEPCLFYVDFEDNIYVYYNLYIQTEPTIQFHDIVKSDTTLVSSLLSQ